MMTNEKLKKGGKKGKGRALFLYYTIFIRRVAYIYLGES